MLEVYMICFGLFFCILLGLVCVCLWINLLADLNYTIRKWLSLFGAVICCEFKLCTLVLMIIVKPLVLDIIYFLVIIFGIIFLNYFFIENLRDAEKYLECNKYKKLSQF